MKKGAWINGKPERPRLPQPCCRCSELESMTKRMNELKVVFKAVVMAVAQQEGVSKKELGAVMARIDSL
jgi:hypothetical protein